MVSLSVVESSNHRASSALPPGLVAVFVGATSGIGEISLKKFAQRTRQPRIYFIGRSQDAADRIVAECKVLNPAGEYNFMRADVSLIRNVDKVCEEIKAKEKILNLLFLSAGVPSMDRSKTSEDLHLLAALNYYSRIRFMLNLLPLIQRAPSLRRVVNVGGGGLEGPIDETDFPALRVPFAKFRGHLCTLVTLGIEAVARTAPEVSFVHDFPGSVDTQFMNRTKGLIGVVLRTYFTIFGRWVCVPIEECGERHFYLATSARYPSADGGSTGVGMESEAKVAQGSNGQIGSGMYSVGWDCESASPTVMDFLAGLREEERMVDKIWQHTEGEFHRITQ